LAIIGGGPAGASIVIRAIHLGFGSELLSGRGRREFELEGGSGGVCIFDVSSKSRFGGGRLQDYKVRDEPISFTSSFQKQINSNTNGAKFVTNITHDRPNVLPPEIASGTPLEHIGKVTNRYPV
jgi:hypothetical protein